MGTRRLHAWSLTALPLVLLQLAACGELQTIAVGACGNGAVDPSNGEDCDRFGDPALGEGTRCAPPGSADQCHYICGTSPGSPVCPAGWGCGEDGLCRHASGRYAEASRSPVPPTFGNLSFTDVDGDQIPDVVAGDYDGLKVRFGTREGDYSRVIGVSLTLSVPADPLLADFDGEDGADLVFVDDVQNILLAATGTPDQLLRPAPFPSQDLNDLDGNTSGQVMYVPMVASTDKIQHLLRVELRADGTSLRFLDGEVALEQPTPHDLTFITVATPFRVPVGNIDADPADEMVLAVDGENKVRIYNATLGVDTLPVLQAGPEITFPGPVFNTGVDLGDVNADNRVDLVGVYRKLDGSLGVAVALGNGAGGFAAATADLRFDNAEAFFGGEPFGFRRPFLLAGDLNGDKRADFLVGNGDEVSLSYLYYRGIIHVASASALTTVDFSFFLDAAAGDVNRDGLADFVLSTESGLDVRKGSPGGLLSQHFVPTGQFPSSLRVGDFDGDRLDDIAFLEGARGAGGALPFVPDLLRIAYGSVDLPPPEPLSVSAWNEVHGIAPAVLGGLSQDATRDLAVTYTDGDGNRWLAELRGRGDRTFLAPLGVNFQEAVLVAGRFDGDHDERPDLLLLDAYTVAEGDPMPPILLQGGSAGFVLDQPVTSSFGDYVVPSCEAASRVGAAADLDGDGVDEALLFYQCDGSSPLMLSVLFVGGANDFVDRLINFELSPAARRPVRVHVGDIDGDGKLDAMVAFAGESTGALLVWNEVMVSGGGSTSEAAFPSARDLVLVNADADPGLELGVLESGVVLIADVVERSVQPAAVVLELEVSSDRLFVGDVDRDGLDDLVAFPHIFLATPFDPALDQPTDEEPAPTDGDCPGTCGLASQCGCGQDESCDLTGDLIECRPAGGSGTETNECTVNEDCAAGYSCIEVFSLGRNQCLEWCDDDSDCEAPGGACDLVISAAGVPVEGAVTCTPNCDPLDNEGCPAGWGCKVYQKSDASRSETLCVPAGAGGQGSACGNEGDCAAGFTCVSSLGQCLRNCQVFPAAGTCPPGTVCSSYDNHPTIGGNEFGQCL